MSNTTPPPAAPRAMPLGLVRIILIITVIVAGIAILSSNREDGGRQGQTSCPSSLRQDDGGGEILSDAFMRGFTDCR